MALPQTSRLLLLSLILAWPTNAPAAPVSPAPKAKLPEGVRALLGNVPAGRGDAVEAVAFSPDSRRLASAHRDHTLRLWDAAIGKKIRQFPGPDKPVAWLLFSPNGRTLLTGSEQGAGEWDTTSGKRDAWLTRQAAASCKRLAGRPVTQEQADESPPEPEMPLPKFRVTDGPPAAPLRPGKDLYGDPLPQGAVARIGSCRLRHQGGARAVAFSPDGKLLASGGADKTVRVWSTADGEQKQCLRGHDNSIIGLTFSSDGKWLASGGEDGNIVLWDVRTGRELDRLSKDGVCLAHLAFTPDNHFLAAVGSPPQGGRVCDGPVFLWDLTTGRRQQKWEGETKEAASVIAFTPGSKSLLLGRGGVLSTRDLLTGKEQRQLKVSASSILALKSLGDGRTLAAMVDAGQRSIEVIDAGNGREVRRFDSMTPPFGSAAIDARGRWLAVGDDQHSSISLHDLDTGKTRWLRSNDQQVRINSVAFSADGKLLASADEEGIVQLWDGERGEERLLRNRPLGGLYGRLSPDGRIMATLEKAYHSLAHSLCLWEAASGRLLRRLAVEGPEFQAIAFSADSKILAAAVGYGFSDNMILLLEPATGKLIRHCRGKTGGIAFLAFAPNNQRLVGGDSERLHLWDVRTGKELPGFSVAVSKVQSGAFSSDGKVLATADDDGILHIRDAATGREIRRLVGHGGFALVDVAFSPDGRSVASADHEGTIFLWQAATGEERHRLRDLPGVAQSLYFAADGRRLLACTAGGGVCIWDTATGKVLQRLKGENDQDSSCSAALSPDGRYLFTPQTEEGEIGGKSGTGNLHSRSLNTGRILRSIRGSDERYSMLTFTADSQFLAAMGYSVDHFHGHVTPTGVRFWEVATGAEIFRLQDLALPFAFSPDGRVVVCPSRSEREAAEGVQCWDVATRRRLGRVAGHLGGVTALAFSEDGRLLATGSSDETILVWDARPLTRDRPPPCPAAPRRLEELWADLAGADAAHAHEALWSLVHRPAEALPFLRAQLHPIPQLDGECVKRWIADLDSDQFDVRRRAAEELERLGELAGPSLRATLTNKPSLEVRRTIEPLLERMEQEVYTGEPLRMLRAIVVLERIGSAEARRLLDKLAHGAAEARVTQQAHASVQRLDRRVPEKIRTDW